MSNDNVAHALSGAGGGALAMTLTYPLVTLSTRAQTESLRAQKEDSEKQASIMAAAREIVRREGISGLYSGLDSALFGIAITNFIYYYFYEKTKSVYLKRTPTLSTAQSMAAGAIAGTATSVLSNPIWVVNTRMTVAKSKRGTLGTISDIYKQGGLKPFFAGIGPALVLVANPVMQYTVFEQLKNVVEKRRKLTAMDAFFLGAFGKIVSTSVTYPYITLKSRMQVSQGSQRKSQNVVQGIMEIINEEGVAGLYKGLLAKVLQSAVTSALLFYFKEHLFAIALWLLGLRRRLQLRRALPVSLKA